jgi:hypothetical protein
MTTPQSMTDLFGPPIASYARAQALEDGVLVDVTETAREAGIKFPVALTAAAWADCVEWTDEDAERTGAYQDQSGRLWDVVWMTRCAIVRGRGASNMVVVDLLRVRRDRRSRRAVAVQLVALCGPGDDAEPVITIMTMDEYRSGAR